MQQQIRNVEHAVCSTFHLVVPLTSCRTGEKHAATFPRPGTAAVVAVAAFTDHESEEVKDPLPGYRKGQRTELLEDNGRGITARAKSGKGKLYSLG